MIDKLNSIWKNLLFDIIVSLSLIGLIIYNLFDKASNQTEFTIAHKISFGLFLLLGLHGLFLVALTVINIVKKKIGKAIFFFLTSIGIFAELYFAAVLLFLSTIGGPPVDEGNRHDFQKSTTCKQLDTNEIKTTVENFRKGVFPSTLDSNFTKNVTGDSLSRPKQITKIECGCRKTDTTIIVFRIWDIDKSTFELELINDNGLWKYESLTIEYFDD